MCCGLAGVAGKARHGDARPGWVRFGTVRFGRRGMEMLAGANRGVAGVVGSGMEWHGK